MVAFGSAGCISDKFDAKNLLDFEKYYRCHKVEDGGFCMPFGDGPKPVFERRVSKTVIINMLGQAESYVYITSPYLIIDNELTSAIENASLRGVDVRIVTPHIPDKKAVFTMTRNSYGRLMDAGVKIYEYEPGFIHAKTYLCDDKYAIVGTINLDYRSLVHHYENGVWIFNHDVIKDIKNDVDETFEKSIVGCLAVIYKATYDNDVIDGHIIKTKSKLRSLNLGVKIVIGLLSEVLIFVYALGAAINFFRTIDVLKRLDKKIGEFNFVRVEE